MFHKFHFTTNHNYTSQFELLKFLIKLMLVRGYKLLLKFEQKIDFFLFRYV